MGIAIFVRVEMRLTMKGKYQISINANSLRKHVLFMFFICSLLSTATFAQAPWYLEIKGRVLKDGKKLDGVTVTTIKNGVPQGSTTTAAGGGFKIKLDANADYVIKISKPGHAAKMLNVSTKNVPEDEAVEEG